MSDNNIVGIEYNRVTNTTSTDFQVINKMEIIHGTLKNLKQV